MTLGLPIRSAGRLRKLHKRNTKNREDEIGERNVRFAATPRHGGGKPDQVGSEAIRHADAAEEIDIRRGFGKDILIHGIRIAQ